MNNKAGATAPSFHVSRAYGAYVLALLWMVGLLRFMDIQVFAVVLESIRAEFQFSDTQLGFLSGLAFAIFYATLGIPIAWLADRYNRRNILSVVLALWSGMTAVCGLATGFVSLFLARMGVGVGEAGANPTIHSLLADYFPAARRGTVFAIVNTSIPAGVFAGFMYGGWVLENYDWRVTFFAYGVPGVILAVILWLTLREPPRGFSENRGEPVESAQFLETVAYLWRQRSYRHLVAATTIMTVGAYGSGIWIPSFFQRIHGLQIGEITFWLAWIYGAGGITGSLLGGWLSDRLSTRRQDARWYVRVPGTAAMMILPFSFFVYLWGHPYQAMTVHIGTTILMHMYLGPAYGTVQSLAGVKRRAMAAGFNLLVINFLGIGFGPVIVGYASDYMNQMYGAVSIRYSLLGLVVIAYTWAALHFFLAGRTLRADIDRARADV
jgi:predicted MFS family arabinose efflux permease